MSARALERFEQSRDRLVQELIEKPSDVQIAVVELTSFPRILMRFGDDPRNTASSVEQLEATHQRGSYLSAFRMANQLLDQSLGAKKSIVLLGDSQQNQWEEGLQSPPFLRGVEVVLPEVDRTSVGNLAVQHPAVRTFYAGDRSVALCSVQVSRFGPRKSAAISFFANGRDLGSQTIEFPEDADSVMLSAEVEVDRATWFRGEFRIVGDADGLAGDDRVRFSLPPLREGQAVLIADSRYVKTAMSPKVMRGRWRTRAVQAAEEQTIELQEEDEVLLVESSQLVHAAVRDVVLDALNSGRGIVMVINHNSPIIQGFMRNLGVEIERPESGASRNRGLRYVYHDHPVFQSLRSSDFGNLSDITVRRYHRLAVEGGLPLVFSQAGDPLLVESRPGKGKVLLFAFDLDRDETNWPLHPTFVPLLDKCLQHVRPESEAQKTMYKPGDRCLWPIPPTSQGVEEVSIEMLEDGDDAEPLRVQVFEGRAEFQVPDRPGHYRIRYDDSPDIRGLLDVNPPEEESHLEFVSTPEALSSWLIEETDQPSTAEQEQLDVPLTKGEIQRQQIWWWLLFAAFVGMIGETVWLCMRKANA
jgi:hypothetical protein